VWKPLEEDGFATVRFTPQGIGQNYRPADGSKPIAQYSEINISNSQPFGAERHQGFDLVTSQNGEFFVVNLTSSPYFPGSIFAGVKSQLVPSGVNKRRRLGNPSKWRFLGKIIDL
jgi:hypothetical protein